jgi:hypothetical protein
MRCKRLCCTNKIGADIIEIKLNSTACDLQHHLILHKILIFWAELAAKGYWQNQDGVTLK